MSLEAVSNGKPHTNAVIEKENYNQDSQPYSSGGASRRISAVRKTLAGWLRLDRSTSTQPPANQKAAQRSKSIENVGLLSGQRSQVQSAETETRGRSAERRLLSWGNWRRRVTSRSVKSHGSSSPPNTQHHPTSPKSPQTSNPSVAKRALPPVPSPPPINHHLENFQNNENAADSPEPRDDDEAVALHGIAAYIGDRPDVEEEEEGAFSVQPGKNGAIDFAASIEKVKSYGWYWGPISREASERLLEPEADGSFIVRDSSADHYIFSLTFKLNGNVSHVRIEHDQGNFSFGSLTKFKSNTIVDFIENAVEHSRSGRYLFFLHRRPERGPMRVQLLNPVSRLKQIRSLQHMCRFVILALVPRDLLNQLPVPKRIRTYLDTPFYYSETIADWTVPGNEPASSFNLSKDEEISETKEPTFEETVLDNSVTEVDGAIANERIVKDTYHLEHFSGQETDSKYKNENEKHSNKLELSQGNLQSMSGASDKPKSYISASNDANFRQSPSLPLPSRNDEAEPDDGFSASENSVLEPCDASPPPNLSSPAPL